MAVASAGSYANSLHLAPDRLPHQHLITQFYRPDALLDAHMNQQINNLQTDHNNNNNNDRLTAFDPGQPG